MELLNEFSRIPEILNLDFTPEEAFAWIKGEFENTLGFDYVILGYMNADSIDIKVISEPDKRVQFSQVDYIGTYYKDFVKQKKGISVKSSPDTKTILNELGINLTVPASAVVIPLTVKNAVFGIVIGIKFDQIELHAEKIAIAEAFAGICAYVIKDAELSNVFKLQLKVLNDNIVEKNFKIEDMKEQNDKIREAEKIKTEFLMNMSHSLRTPLNAIIGFSEALDMKIFGDLNAKQQEYVLDIQNAGKEMLGLVNDILDMSKIEAGAMKLLKTELDLIIIINEVVNIVKSLANKKNITIKTNLPNYPVFVHADGQKFNQIMFNLLGNAIKFTNNDGNIEVGLIEKENVVQIYIKDDGIGIDKKYYGKIFGKFEQISNDYSGKYSSTGIGLTITKELIELHKGKIWVESVLNNGTTFTFELPIE